MPAQIPKMRRVVYGVVSVQQWLKVGCLAGCLIICVRGGPAVAGLFYAGVSSTNLFWPGGIIPYEFDTNSALTAAQKATYLDGLREWELAANVHLVARTVETNYLLLRFGFQQGVNTFVLGTPSVLTIDSLRRNQICHEMGHALGLDHENTRPDRDTFISINFTNLDPSATYLYELATNDTMYGNYDFESVMHYGRDLFAINPNVDVITPQPDYFVKYYYRIGNFATSVGDRAAVAFLYGPPTNALTSVVTRTADSGFGSLRAAIYYANDHPGTTITFNISTNDPGYANGVWTIKATGEMPPLVANGTVLDGGSQPGFTDHPLIALDGSALLPEAYSSSGLYLYATNCTVRDLALINYSFCGIVLQTISAVSNTLAGCHVGVDASGSNAAPNAYQGVYLNLGANNNFIGGTDPGDRNIISGNTQYGVLMLDPNTSNNIVLGNYIGVSKNGAVAISNAIAGVGIWGGSRNNTVGGADAGAGNVISGNGYGVLVSDTNTFGNSVLGNLIGTDATGTLPIPNEFGVGILGGARTNSIGGARNIIAGNQSYGIVIAGQQTSFNQVQANYIGSDHTGSNAVPNGTGIGIWGGARYNTVGDPSTRDLPNLISGNTGYGVLIADPGTTSNLVTHARIGSQADGMTSLPNGTGIGIFGGASRNTVLGNTISGNNADGVLIADAGTTGNEIQGNVIGLNRLGTAALPNAYSGVSILSGAERNLVGGGSGLVTRNVLSGNGGSGVYLAGANTSQNVIRNNYIGTDATGNAPLGNGAEGVAIFGGATSNLIGGIVADTGNVIGASTYRGIFIADTNTSGNLVQGNFIGVGADGVSPLTNGFDGVAIANGASGNVIGLASDGSGKANRIAFSTYDGVYLGYGGQPGTSGNSVRGNAIYTNGYLGINLAGGTEDFLGVTTNDIDDGDGGPNHLQNFPVIITTYAGPATTTVLGRLNSAANRSYLIDIYRNANPDVSGYGEGENYVGSTGLTTDDNGNGSFIFVTDTNFAGQYFTASATDTTTGDTSEFSLAALATNALPPPQFNPPLTLTSSGFVGSAVLAVGQSYRIQAATNLVLIPTPWTDLTNFIATATNYLFLDPDATNYPMRFYRVVSP